MTAICRGISGRRRRTETVKIGERYMAYFIAPQ